MATFPAGCLGAEIDVVVRIRIVRDERSWLALEPQWDALLAASGSDCFFLTWAWLRAWWETYRDDYDLLVLVAEDARGPCGIAPCVVTRDGRLEFMGTNAAWGEYPDLVVERGRETPTADALAAQLLEAGDGNAPLWRTALFRFVRRDAVCAPHLRRVFARGGRVLAEQGAEFSPYATLPVSWHAYLAAHSANFRSWITRNENRLARLGPIRLLFAGRDISLDEAFDRMAALHAHRWGHPFEEKFGAFHRRLSDALLPLGRLVLVLLSVGDDVLAAKYDFAYRGKIWCYQGGWRRDLAEYRLGNVMLARLLQWAIDSGFSEYDFLAGDVPYKRRWSNACRETVNLSC